MKPILVITHVDYEGPGYLATVLDRRNIPFHILSIDRGDAIPERSQDFRALVLMGGPMSVNDPLPWIEPELNLIRTAISQSIPTFGHCLGGQLISKALGGVVTRNRVKEIGWYDVEWADAAVHSTWADELPSRFPVFHWHGETFSIPNGATPLLRNAHCENQAFVFGNTVAMQCHIEMTEAIIRDWIAHAPEEFVAPNGAVQSATEITRDLTQRVHALQTIADVIYELWLNAVVK